MHILLRSFDLSKWDGDVVSSEVEAEDEFLARWNVFVQDSEEVFVIADGDSFVVALGEGVVQGLWAAGAERSGVLGVSTYADDGGVANYVFDILEEVEGEDVGAVDVTEVVLGVAELDGECGYVLPDWPCGAVGLGGWFNHG